MQRIVIGIFCYLFLSPQFVNSQVDLSAPFIDNYSPKTYQGSAQNWSIVQDHRGMIYIANGDEGIMEYDGTSWRKFKVNNNSTIRALTYHKKRIYVGAIAEMGYLEPDELGNIKYKSLIPKLAKEDREFADVWTSHSTSKGVYMYTDNKIYRINDTIIKTWTPKTGSFFLSYECNNKVFVFDNFRGLQFINENDELVLVPDGEKLVNERIYFILPYNDNSYLIGTRQNGILKLDLGKNINRLTPFKTTIDKFLIDNNLYCATILPDSTYAIGTLNKGIVIIDRKGNLLKKIDKNSGLIDEVIYYLFTDKQNHLWCALSNGVSKVNLSSPITHYNESLGIKGSVLTFVKSKNDYYAGTFVGMFKLEDDGFVQLKHINRQSWCLKNFYPDYPDKSNPILLAGDNIGFHKINDKKVSTISEFPIVFDIFQSKINPQILYVGHLKGLEKYEYKDGNWNYISKIKGVNATIRMIQEDRYGDLWMGTNVNGIIHVDFDSLFNSFQIIKYDSSHGIPQMSDIKVFNYRNNIYFGTEKGLLEFDEKQKRFNVETQFISNVNEPLTRVYLFQEDYNRNIWITSGKHVPDAFGYLKPAPEFSFDWYSKPFKITPSMGIYTIYHEDSNSSWFGGTEGLYKYDHNHKDFIDFDFNTIIRRVTISYDSIAYNGYKNTQDLENFVIAYEKNDITFEFAALNYIAEENNLYQYQLIGYDDELSDWTFKNTKEYTNIREGNYTFIVKAKNIYGYESNFAQIQFEVESPWYRSVIAYIVYLILVGIAIRIILSIYTRGLKLTNLKLESLVLARTSEIEQQKEEIKAQAELLAVSNLELEKLSVVTSKTTNAVMLMDEKGNISWVNEGFEKLYGYKLEELQDLNMVKLKDPSYNDISFDNVIRCINNKEPVFFENLNYTKEGNKIWAQTTITPILNDDDEVVQLVAIDSDITQLKKIDEELKQKNSDITDSISYASRIQQAMMPSFDDLQKHFADSFIVFIPKDIVSGDFFWFSENNNKLVIAVADCTGHGVPGAFMSLIGISFLNKIVNEMGITSTSEILNHIRNNLMTSLHKSISKTSADGMDISIICIDKKTNELEFSGAMNPLYQIRNNSLKEFHGDKIPIGIYEMMDNEFTSEKIKIKEGDIFYMFTDGYVDQFGGNKGNKFKYHRFKELLVESSKDDFEKQKEKLLQAHFSWKGDYDQIDDILILGIKI